MVSDWGYNTDSVGALAVGAIAEGPFRAAMVCIRDCSGDSGYTQGMLGIDSSRVSLGNDTSSSVTNCCFLAMYVRHIFNRGIRVRVNVLGLGIGLGLGLGLFELE